MNTIIGRRLFALSAIAFALAIGAGTAAAAEDEAIPGSDPAASNESSTGDSGPLVITVTITSSGDGAGEGPAEQQADYEESEALTHVSDPPDSPRSLSVA